MRVIAVGGKNKEVTLKLTEQDINDLVFSLNESIFNAKQKKDNDVLATLYILKNKLKPYCDITGFLSGLI